MSAEDHGTRDRTGESWLRPERWGGYDRRRMARQLQQRCSASRIGADTANSTRSALTQIINRLPQHPFFRDNSATTRIAAAYRPFAPGAGCAAGAHGCACLARRARSPAGGHILATILVTILPHQRDRARALERLHAGGITLLASPTTSPSRCDTQGRNGFLTMWVPRTAPTPIHRYRCAKTCLARSLGHPYGAQHYEQSRANQIEQSNEEVFP